MSAGLPEGWYKRKTVKTERGEYKFAGFADRGYDFDLLMRCPFVPTKQQKEMCKEARRLSALKCGRDCKDYADQVRQRGIYFNISRCIRKCRKKGIKFPSLGAIITKDCSAVVEELRIEFLE